MIRDVYLVSDMLNPFPESEINGLRHLIEPPLGYEEYLRTYGKGTYCNDVVIWGFSEIQSQLSFVREWTETLISDFSRYNFIGTYDSTSVVPIGYTHSGDYLIMFPDHPGRIWGLPRHDDCLYHLPDGFHDLLNWVRLFPSEYGTQYVHVPPFRYFEPDLNRRHKKFTVKSDGRLNIAVGQVFSAFGDSESRMYGIDSVQFLFIPSVGARAQILQNADQSYATGTIVYDASSETAVARALSELE